MIIVEPTSKQVERRAYQKYLSRGCAHGHHEQDWADAVKELTREYPDRATQAESETVRGMFRTWEYREVFDWNLTALKVLANDYFPLLKSDDMAEYGDRVSAKDMFEMILQGDRMFHKGSRFTEQEFDELLSYRNMLAGVSNYVVENSVPASQSLLPCEEGYDVSKLTDLPFGRVKVGAKMRVKVNDSNSRHGTMTRVAEPGDEFVVNRIGMNNNFKRQYVYHIVENSSQWLWYDNCEPVDYYPIDQRMRPFPAKAAATATREKPGLNVHMDLFMRQDEFLGFRMNPAHLADVVALRARGFVTAQQAKILVVRCWEDWCCHDVFYHLNREGFLGELEGDLEDVLKPILAEQEQAVKDYRGGKVAAFGRLMGVAMRAARGKAEPGSIRAALERLISAA